MYRLLLLAFPRRVRREFGEDMARLFADQLQATRAAGESVARLWLRAAADAVVHGGAERLAAMRARTLALARSAARWRWWMHALRQDLRHALRLLVVQRGITAVALITLALGIGANTAIFSAVDAVLLRPLPYDDPDRLVMVWEKRQAEGVLDNVVSPADYLDWVRMNSVFEALAAMTTATADLTGNGEPVRLTAGVVSPRFFDVLRVHPALGRSFRDDEAIVGRHRVVILGDGLWRKRFGSDPGVVGRPLLLNGIPHEVVGVLSATFQFPNSDIELWSPLALEGGAESPARASHFLSVYARLKPHVTLPQARADMDRVAAQLSQQYPETNRTHGAWVTPLAEDMTKPVRSGLLLLLGAVAFVLLIACVNVANLLLARAAGRRREMAVRAALGAGRSRLLGQTLTESLVLGVLGGAAGLLVAKWGIQLLKQLAPQGVQVLGANAFGLDTRVLAFALGISLLTGLLFGLLPAWQLATQNVNTALKDAGRGTAGVRRRLRLALVISEIALASLLLVGAGLTLRSFQTLLRSQPGFATEGVLAARVALPQARYRGKDKLVATFDQIEQRLSSIPGVRSAGATSFLPLSDQDTRRGVAIEGRERTPDSPTRAHPRSVTPGYFHTLGIRLLAGRSFTHADRADTPRVAIVNDTMARRYWPGISPLGRRVMIGGTSEWLEVIGIIRDVRHWGLDRDVNPELYLPLTQYVSTAMSFVVATDGDPIVFAAQVRDQLKAIDADLPLSEVRTMSEVAAESMAARRMAMLLLGIFGALALLLAAAGIYGVMAHLVALRTAEIGVRMTLGARPADIMRLILREGVMQTLAGLAIGLLGAVLLMRSFRAMLYEVSPADPLTLAVVAALLLGTAVLACMIPARRAMNIDPVGALRQ